MSPDQGGSRQRSSSSFPTHAHRLVVPPSPSCSTGSNSRFFSCSSSSWIAPTMQPSHCSSQGLLLLSASAFSSAASARTANKATLLLSFSIAALAQSLRKEPASSAVLLHPRGSQYSILLMSVSDNPRSSLPDNQELTV